MKKIGYMIGILLLSMVLSGCGKEEEPVIPVFKVESPKEFFEWYQTFKSAYDKFLTSEQCKKEKCPTWNLLTNSISFSYTLQHIYNYEVDNTSTTQIKKEGSIYTYVGNPEIKYEFKVEGMIALKAAVGNMTLVLAEKEDWFYIQQQWNDKSKYELNLKFNEQSGTFVKGVKENIFNQIPVDYPNS